MSFYLKSILLPLNIVFCFFALGQTQLGDLNIKTNPDLYSDESFKAYHSKSFFSNKSDSYKVLKNPIRVQIPQGARGFSHPSLKDGSGFTLSRSKYECNYSQSLNGDLLFVSEGVAAVRLDPHRSCQSGKLNSVEGKKDVVFFKLDQVQATGEWSGPQDTWSGEDAATEAAYSVQTNYVPTRSNQEDLEEVVKVLMKEQENSPVDPQEGSKNHRQIKEFMGLNCTQHQTDYDLVYSELITLTGRVFNVAYYDKGTNGIKKDRTVAVDKERSQFASLSDGPVGTPPALIRPSPEAITCIARQESQWNKYATSHTGAVGIGQQTDVNVADLKCFLYGCKQKRAEAWATQLWDQYHDQAESRFPKSKYPGLYRNKKTGKPCTRKLTSKAQVGYCPISSIAAIALYQMIVERDIRRVTKTFNDDNREFTGDERLEVLEVLATSHNAGRTVARIVAKGGQIDSWAETMSKLRQSDRGDGGKEVRNYHQIMKSCLSAKHMGDFSPKDRIKDCEHLKNNGSFSSLLNLDRVKQEQVPIPTPRPEKGVR